MKKSIARKWVKALRSGEYEQGTGQLVDDIDNFCCLGVLCNIAPDSLGLEWEKEYGEWRMGGNSQVLPPKVREWAGLKTQDGQIPSIRDDLADLNDNGMSFVEIADIIEKHYEEL